MRKMKEKFKIVPSSQESCQKGRTNRKRYLTKAVGSDECRVWATAVRFRQPEHCGTVHTVQNMTADGNSATLHNVEEQLRLSSSSPPEPVCLSGGDRQRVALSRSSEFSIRKLLFSKLLLPNVSTSEFFFFNFS